MKVSPLPEKEGQDTEQKIPAIRAEGLTRRFESLLAVDHLTFTVAAGSIFGLLGPNGAGKSTLIKMLTTLLPATSGAAWVAGFDILREPEKVRRAIRLRIANAVRRW
jgi:ABC-2 type transport system ATP-binding protein